MYNCKEQLRFPKYALLMFLHEQLPLIIIVLGYVLCGFVMQSVFKIDRMINLKFSYSLLNYSCIYFSSFFLCLQILRGKTRDYFNVKTLFGAFLIIGLAPPFMSMFSSLKQVIPLINNFTWDYWFMKIDYFLHLRNHPWEILGFMLKYKIIIKTIDFLYMLWFPALFFMCLWMAWSSRRQLRLQFFVTACSIWILLGTFVALVLSSAGPCYYSSVVETQYNPYQPLFAHLMEINKSTPLYALKNQTGIWQAYQSNVWLPFGGISAMPSIHVAIAVLIALVGWGVNRYVGIFLSLYAFVIQIGSFMLGWHYAIDGYLSAFLTLLLWKATGKIIPIYFKAKAVNTFYPDNGQR